MRVLAAVLLMAPLLAFAGPKESSAEKESAGMPAYQHCFTKKCMKSDAQCRKDCGKDNRCLARCAKDTSDCARGCGIPIEE